MSEGRMRQKRSFGRFKRREPALTMEKKVDMFIRRNSQNGYFTKFSTITSKFSITESETWDVVGMLLSGGGFESIHDPTSGEMKIYESGKKYDIMSNGRRRRAGDNRHKQPDRKESRGREQGSRNMHGRRNGRRNYSSGGKNNTGRADGGGGGRRRPSHSTDQGSSKADGGKN